MSPTDRRSPHRRTAALLFAPLLAVAALTVASCGTTGGSAPRGSAPAEGRQAASDVTGEVVRVELFEQHLLVRDTYDRIHRVRFERDTPVHYQGNTYPPQNLEPGDLVRVQVRGDRSGALFAVRVDVEQSVQDRGGHAAPPPELDEVEGEVTRVEQLPNLLVLRGTTGETLRIAYSADTPVYYRGERYAVSNLEPGDEVRAEVRRDGAGNLRTDYIAVTRSVQERGGGTTPIPGTGEPAGVETFTGRVTTVEPERGRFTVATDTRGTITVLMPYRPLTADRDHFERLRTGDRVRFDGEWLGTGRVELARFDLRY